MDLKSVLALECRIALLCLYISSLPLLLSFSFSLSFSLSLPLPLPLPDAESSESSLESLSESESASESAFLIVIRKTSLVSQVYNISPLYLFNG